MHRAPIGSTATSRNPAGSRGRRRASLGWLALALSVGACSQPPARRSPALELAEDLPEGAELPWGYSANASHTAWAYGLNTAPGSTLEIHDEGGTIATTEQWASTFDVGPDRSVALCGLSEVRTFDGSSWSGTPLSAMTPEGDRYACTDIAVRAADDVWTVLSEPFEQRRSDSAAVLPDLLCRWRGSAWTCVDLPNPAGADPQASLNHGLVLTSGHAWWISNGDLLTVDTSLPIAPLAVTTVVSNLEQGAFARLQPVPDAEAVLVTYGRSQDRDASDVTFERIDPSRPPERISIDRVRESYALSSERGGNAEVWIARGGVLLALDVLEGQSCSSGSFFAYSGGTGGCSVSWTQLVLYQVGSGEPVELGHANHLGGEQTSSRTMAAVERTDGTYMSVMGHGWHRWP